MKVDKDWNDVNKANIERKPIRQTLRCPIMQRIKNIENALSFGPPWCDSGEKLPEHNQKAISRNCSTFYHFSQFGVLQFLPILGSYMLWYSKPTNSKIFTWSAFHISFHFYWFVLHYYSDLVQVSTNISVVLTWWAWKWQVCNLDNCL